ENTARGGDSRARPGRDDSRARSAASRAAHHEHLGSRHRQRIDADGARSAWHWLLRGVCVSVGSHHAVTRAARHRRAARSRVVGGSHEHWLPHDRGVRRPSGRRVPGAGGQGARHGPRDRPMKERVLVAMSGGVDSSVAAAMLVEEGYDVVGATMKLFCHTDDLPDRPCCSLDSVNDARRVCQQLGVPHYVLNLESAFGRDVVDDFVAEYARGRTPIPCVRCNTFTKFRDLLVKADAIDATWIATGHYAR